MNPTNEKFISLFLVFSLMILSLPLFAKKKRGAKLLITKKDGQQLQGELITVKPNSLLLLDAEGKDESIDIVDIRIIRIMKKSKFWTGAGIGLSITAIFGVVLGTIGAIKGVSLEEGIPNPLVGLIASLLQFGLPCALLGGLIGAIAGKDKTIQIEGMTESEIQKAFDRLRKKARVPDYK
jgi:hypothetical protein